jgi:hypothetical protein
MEPANRQFIPQAARPSSRAALCVLEPPDTLPHGRRFSSGPSLITSRRHSTRVPRDPALEPFYARGGVLVTAHSLIAMLEIAISLIVVFALGYGVRGWAFRQTTRDKGDAVLFEHARALGPKFQTAN